MRKRGSQPSSTRILSHKRKGQFYIITAVVIAGILFLVSNALVDYARLPYGEVERDPGQRGFFTARGVVDGAWFNASWRKRTPLTVTERSTTVLEEYSALTTVNTSRLIDEGVMQGDCDDIRAIENGEERPVAVFDCGSGDAEVWFKTDVDADATEKDTFLYYDNTNAERANPRTEAFIHFENADNVGEWSERDNSWDATGGIYTSGTDTVGGTWTLFNDTSVQTRFSDGFLIETQINTPGNAIAGLHFWHNGSLTDNDFWVVNVSDTGGGNRLNVSLIEHDSGSTQVKSGPVPTLCQTNEWCEIAVGVDNDTVVVFVNETEELRHAVARDDNDNGLLGLHGHTDEDQDFDDIIIRPFVDPEPSVTVRSEQTFTQVMEKIRFLFERQNPERPHNIDLGIGTCTNMTVRSPIFVIEERIC